jgi:actin-like ATPase involved in cell morphogenesis
MTEEIKEEVVEQPKKEKKPKMIDQLAIGLDVGTGNFCMTRSDQGESKILRNAFYKVDKEDINIDELSSINFIKNQDGEIYVIGNDAFSFCNIFGKEVSRPMETGVISSKEIDAIDVLTLMIKHLIGDTIGKKVYVNYSIPAESIDKEKSITYHEKVFGRILTALGYECKPINEGMAVVYSECAKDNFTAIGCSFGAGMSNFAISFKGVEAAKFSTSRGGDWIDNQVADSLNMVSNRVSNIKEKYLNLETGFIDEPDKKKRRVLEALTYYYESLMNYTIKRLVKEFETNVDLDIDAIPIILSGGTSSPPGFVTKFKEVISGYSLPFQVSEIRHAKNPLTAVSTGLLVKALTDIY